MNFLEEKILKEGRILSNDLLKVDSFLNHQIDTRLMREIADELRSRFHCTTVTKILTIEASGIAIAVMLGSILDVPVVFAKKSESVNSTDEKYVSYAYSFTRLKTFQINVSRPYLSSSDKVLIVDDFLARGEAALALTDIVAQAGAEVAGIGIAIEKGQQEGGRRLRSAGFRVESIAIIEEMDAESQTVKFRN